MKLTILLLFLFVVSTSVAISAPQEQMVTGTVTDADTDEPLSGVNVLVEGTQTGVSTDLNGKFSLQKPANGAIIVFSFVGFTTERITYTGQPVVDMKLSQAVMELDQVVVIGYGTIKKSDLTGSVASVTSKEIEKSTSSNIESALQGRVPGLMVISNSGAPGSEPAVRIRGIGTVNNNNPIYIVDGMVIDPGQADDATNIRFLNPWDIASVEVLKDASAQAIYGSRGANGVILITTRKGSEGLPKITFSSTISFLNAIKVPKVLNREEFHDFILSCYTNGYIRTHPGTGLDIPVDTLMNRYPTVSNMIAEYNEGTYTDWLSEIVRKNVVNQNYNFSLSGGTKYARYSASAGYLNSDGLLKNFNYKRYSFRLNTDFNVGRYVTIGENLGITLDKKKGHEYYYGNFFIRKDGPFSRAMEADPLTPVLKSEGEFDANNPDYEYNKYAASPITGGNPLLDLNLISMNKSGLTLVGNMFAEASILKDLKIRSSWGFNLANDDWSDYAPEYSLSSMYENKISTVYASSWRTNGWIWENTLTYSKKLKNHSITALFGYTSEYSKVAYQTAIKQGTPNNDPEMQTFDAATTQPNVTGGYKVNTMISYLGRINYSFLDKYLLTASLRHDGSSKFGSGHRWGTFPSFSLGWKISNEKFFKNLEGEFISNLKLRAGWGQIGNSSLPVYYAYVSQVSSNSADEWIDNRYIFDEKVSQGYFLNTIGTPGLSWETTEQTNIGFDMAILKNSLSVTVDYYIKNTKDMLLQVQNPRYAGYPWTAAPYTNAGSVQNKGFEIIADYRGKAGELSYDIAVNGSMFKNKVTSLGRGNNPIISEPNRTEVGKPIGSFYGYVTNGIFQTEEEVQNYKGPGGTMLQPDAHAGDFRFKNLNFDNTIDANDETWIGNPWPKLTYGINLSLGYKAFDFILFFQGSYGNDIFNIGTRRHLSLQGSMNEFEYIYKNAWRGPGTSDSQPLLTTVDNNNNYRNSDYFIEKGSYLRLKNFQFGYNLPTEVCDRVKITNGRIWVGGTNLLTFTKYRGIDPEVDYYGIPTDAGCDWNDAFPKSREISLGATISF